METTSSKDPKPDAALWDKIFLRDFLTDKDLKPLTTFGDPCYVKLDKLHVKATIYIHRLFLYIQSDDLENSK
jgi:hypothetical protein